MRTRVILDCDPGHDDAIALLLALASPELEVAGVTTVSGNTSVENGTRNALKILELAGRTDVPVAAGAERPLVRERFAAKDVHGESGLDGPELPEPKARAIQRHAVDFMAETIVAVPDNTTLVPVGPLTNIALLLALHPRVTERIERIVLMGGAVAEGNVTPAAEFNVWADPEAARRVFESGLDVTMVGLDVTHQARVGPADFERLRAGGRVGTVVAELLEFYGAFHRRIYGFDGSPIHDAVAVAHIIRGDILQTEQRHVAVDTESRLSRGRTLVDVWRRTGNEPNAHVGLAIDSDAFRELLFERLARLG